MAVVSRFSHFFKNVCSVLDLSDGSQQAVCYKTHVAYSP